jgi:hypothetical protein
VGTTALGTRAAVATPLDTSFVGVEVQATVIDNLLRQDFVYQPVHHRTFESLAVIVLGMTVTMLAVRLGLSAAGFGALVALATMWSGSLWLLSTTGAFMSPLYPTVAVVLAFIFVTVGKVGIERRRAETALPLPHPVRRAVTNHGAVAGAGSSTAKNAPRRSSSAPPSPRAAIRGHRRGRAAKRHHP